MFFFLCRAAARVAIEKMFLCFVRPRDVLVNVAFPVVALWVTRCGLKCGNVVVGCESVCCFGGGDIVFNLG